MFKMKKAAALALAAVMAIGSLAGCGAKEETPQVSQAVQEEAGGTKETAEPGSTKEPVTLKVLMNGDKPNDWDRVLEEFYARTKETLNITFDWTWVPAADYKDKLNVKMTAGEEYRSGF